MVIYWTILWITSIMVIKRPRRLWCHHTFYRCLRTSANRPKRSVRKATSECPLTPLSVPFHFLFSFFFFSRFCDMAMESQKTGRAAHGPRVQHTTCLCVVSGIFFYQIYHRLFFFCCRFFFIFFFCCCWSLDEYVLSCFIHKYHSCCFIVCPGHVP